LHSLVRQRGPFLGADLPPAERRAQVLSRMPLAAPARSVGSSWTRPSTALCLSRVELTTPSKATTPNRVLHGEQMRGRFAVSTGKPTDPVATPLESAQYQYTALAFRGCCREAGISAACPAILSGNGERLRWCRLPHRLTGAASNGMSAVFEWGFPSSRGLTALCVCSPALG
jgi:hypothetical protein